MNQIISNPQGKSKGYRFYPELVQETLTHELFHALHFGLVLDNDAPVSLRGKLARTGIFGQLPNFTVECRRENPTHTLHGKTNPLESFAVAMTFRSEGIQEPLEEFDLGAVDAEIRNYLLSINQG
jgi:hypothetical protein